MALRKIVEQGDECLTKVCRPVTEFNSRLHELLDDMVETLADAFGLPKARVVFKGGAPSKTKRVLLAGLTSATVDSVLSSLQ